MPLPRTEVAAAVVGSEIVVLGGFTIDGGASQRVDAYSPARDTWRRLPGPPCRRSSRDGGGSRRTALCARRLHVVRRGAADASSSSRAPRGERFPRMPFPRAAAGAGVAGRRIVVAGGIGEGRRLARNALVFDLRTRRWSVVAGPDPARAPRRDGARGNGLRGRRAHGGARHEPPHVRELPARAARMAAAAAGSRLPRRNRSGRARRAGRLGRRRGAGRDDRGGSRLPRRRASAGSGCRICRRRGTAWASPRSADASTSSAAGRSRG